MEKHIRPLAVFKRINKKCYDGTVSGMKMIFDNPEGESKKSFERKWYYAYAYFGWYIRKREQDDFNDKDGFFKDGNFKVTNVCFGFEIGQLLLTAWYYNQQKLGIELADYIHELWQKKQQQGGQFNDLEFAEICRHIRMNFPYYVQYPNNAKLTLAENLFPDEYPDSEEKDDMAYYFEIMKAHRKRGIDYWIARCIELEDIFYNYPEYPHRELFAIKGQILGRWMFD